MEIKKLTVQTLPEALRNISVGETCYAPDNIEENTVRKTCSLLKEKGYLYSTSMKLGKQTITRLK